ncbi:MAG: DPP IV N-terminal domain-containing protein [Longimicrobiales bacterium]|nr:DPP IV N-terminal domain-containing protein [Longimicrobiales bacterium]
MRRLLSLALVALVVTSASEVYAQSRTTESSRSDEPGFVGGPGSANWQLAARWAPYQWGDMLYDLTVSPRYIRDSNKFWYEWETSDGTFWYIVDPAQRTKREVWDRDALAAELTRITRDPWDAQHLPIEDLEFIDDNTIRFEVEGSQEAEVEVEESDTIGDTQEEGGRRGKRETEKERFHFEWDIATQTLRELEGPEEPENHPDWANISPDGATIVFAQNHNLYMIDSAQYRTILDARQGKEGEKADTAAMEVALDSIQLTTDGEAYYSYASGFGTRGTNDVDKEEEWAKKSRPSLSWSADSRRFALTRSDQREVDFLFVIHNTGHDRPELESYKYDMPGEENVTQDELLLYDLDAREVTEVEIPDPWKDRGLSILTHSEYRYPQDKGPFRSQWFGLDPNTLWFVRTSRDLHRIDVMKVDATTGAVSPVVEERMNTYQEWTQPERLENGDFIWWSERDGWAHLYLYDENGAIKRRLTEGPWHVADVVRVDEDRGQIFFTANGREEGIDPYYAHLYRVNLDGSGLVRVSEGNYDSRVSIPETGNYVVHSYSRVDTIPRSVLRDRSGQVIMELEEADLSRLAEAGYHFPEPFSFEAADGITDIYGVMYKPFDFDSTKVYPIIEYVYPGPQTEAVSKFWSTNSTEQAIANLGFVVVTLGNRGGHPDRSKWYHNYSYGNLRDYGLADKVAGIEQLADRHPFIDRERVGIYGHSGGGFMSTAALLNYPEIFDVAVSSSGNHDNQIYNRWWSETHHGVKEVVDDSANVSFEYEIDSNIELASNLKGKLLLTTGDVDNNVHHANTVRMAQALVQANKRFDYFVFPGQRHGYGTMSNYWFWLRAEYFARHLLGDDRTAADIDELNAERERR